MTVTRAKEAVQDIAVDVANLWERFIQADPDDAAFDVSLKELTTELTRLQSAVDILRVVGGGRVNAS